jgi:hypothetical protein
VSYAARFRVVAFLIGAQACSAVTKIAAPTFYKDVLPVLQKNCQGCHRAGEIGPMAFTDYRGTRPWAKSIKTAVLSRKMPPWFADPRYGHFANDRRLKEDEINTLVSWVNAGAPQGDAKDGPAPMHWREGWGITPDVVFEMPQPFTIPASGTLDYAYIVFPTGFTKDTWVTAGEIRPGARSVVHHMSAIVRPPGDPWLRDAKPGVPYFPPGGAQPETDMQAGLITMNDEFLAGYSPGMQPQRFDTDHSAKLIPAGSDIVLQVHYTPNGKTAVQDRTRIGLTLAKAPPAKRFYSAVVNSAKWEIPPGDPNYEGHARLTFGEPVELVFVQPHMHVRGKDMTVRLVYPTGESETLLSVPHYDFNWQIVYYLAKPLHLPQGTKVEVTAHWDNSANNARNPDPSKAVRWGNQSWDEMLSVPLAVIVDRD